MRSSRLAVISMCLPIPAATHPFGPSAGSGQALSRCSALIGRWLWGDTPHAPRAWAAPPRPLLSQSAFNITVVEHLLPWIASGSGLPAELLHHVLEGREILGADHAVAVVEDKGGDRRDADRPGPGDAFVYPVPVEAGRQRLA
jgi:hypothetical protein